MKKKISFIITSLERAGAETVVSRLAKDCFERGYDVEIVMLLYNKVEIEIPAGINIVNLTGKTKSRIRRIHYWIKNLKDYFNQRHPDIIVSFIARINLLTLLAAKNVNSKLIISERNDPRHDSRTCFTRFLINRFYPKADNIVFQTNAAKELFSKKIQSKAVVIPNPIEIKQIASEKYDQNLFLYAGRCDKQKNVETILEAAKIVSKHDPAIRFELYGNGPLKEKLKDQIEKENIKNVLLHDNVPNIHEKMLNAKFLILSSLYEGMSNSLLEAIYSGVPCLTTKTLGSEVVKEGENGYFFDFKNANQLANLILDSRNEENYLLLRRKAISIAKSIDHRKVFEDWETLFAS